MANVTLESAGCLISVFSGFFLKGPSAAVENPWRRWTLDFGRWTALFPLDAGDEKPLNYKLLKMKGIVTEPGGVKR